MSGLVPSALLKTQGTRLRYRFRPEILLQRRFKQLPEERVQYCYTIQAYNARRCDLHQRQ